MAIERLSFSHVFPSTAQERSEFSILLLCCLEVEGETARFPSKFVIFLNSHLDRLHCGAEKLVRDAGNELCFRISPMYP